MVLSNHKKGGNNMSVWKLKCCPRCQGDVFLDSDLDGWYEKCLQCSYERELKILEEFTERHETKKPALASR